MIGTWLLLYILGAILGGALLSWLLMGAKHDSKMKRLIDVANKDKTAIQNLAHEINQFKAQTKQTLALKDKEISKLRSSIQTNGVTKKDSLDEELERELSKLKTRVVKEGDNKQLLSLKSELDRKNRIVEEAESYIVKLEEKLSENKAAEVPCKKLKKKLKKYKRKLKVLQEQKTKGTSIETIEIIETIDLSKLKKLLKKGKLTKKTKKISKKKAEPISDS